MGRHRRGFRQRIVVLRCPRVAVAVALLVPLLSGCGPSEEPPGQAVNLAQDVLASRDVLNVLRVDTDNDEQDEWVVFYRFDRVEDRGPVAGLVYDVVLDPSSHLPIVYPYRLRTPNEDYLAQGEPKVVLIELVPEPAGATPRKELLLKTDSELAFFKVTSELVNQPSDNPSLYRCIGFFRSRDGVYYNPDNHEVVVTSRAAYERSQLVTKHYYRPEADGYFVTGTTTLVTPFGSAVDFPAGIPEDVLDTPYPEKIVLAFYRTLGTEGAKPPIVECLTAQAATEFQQGRLRYGSPWPLDELKLAVVKELGYYPTDAASQSTVVTVKVVFHRNTGEMTPLFEVRWTMVRVQNQWKMDYPQS